MKKIKSDLPPEMILGCFLAVVAIFMGWLLIAGLSDKAFFGIEVIVSVFVWGLWLFMEIIITISSIYLLKLGFKKSKKKKRR